MAIIQIYKCSVCGEVFEDVEDAIEHTDHVTAEAKEK